MLGNKVALFRTWQAALQLCLGMGLIWLEIGRCPHSNAATTRFIRLQFGSLLCSHVAGIRLIHVKLGSQPWNKTSAIMSSLQADFQWPNQG